jgi:hypothetical protein
MAIRREAAGVLEVRSAFVLMPFAAEFQAGYDDVIAPGVAAAGLAAMRADQDALGNIHGMMFERIFESPVVIADVSGANPNVFYELGISHSTARRTVTVVREDYRDHIPFDIAPCRVLIYPKHPGDSCSVEQRAAYEKAAAESAAALAASLTVVLDASTEGIDNPVQDFMTKRSPLTCSESRHVDALTDTHEQAMIANANSDIVAAGITCDHFTRILCRVIEDCVRITPLRVRLLALDPDDRDGWRYVYYLRKGRALTENELDELFAEDRMIVQRTARTLADLNTRDDFEGEILYVSAIPIFWAYVVDNDRMFVGNYAMNRYSARLPVSVLVKDDPRTRTLFRYYAHTIGGMQAGAKPRGESPPRS